jgi:hypothetical protein
MWQSWATKCPVENKWEEGCVGPLGTQQRNNTEDVMERKMMMKLPTLEERFSGRDVEYVNRSRLAWSAVAFGNTKGAVGETTGCKQ